MGAGMTSNLHFEAGGTIGSQVVEGSSWVSVDITDLDTAVRLTVFISKKPAQLRELAQELSLITDRLLGIAEELEEPEANDSNALPATDPAAYPELSMEVNG